MGSDEVANWSLGIEVVTKSAGFASLDPGVVPASGCIDQSVMGMDVAQWDFILVNPRVRCRKDSWHPPYWQALRGRSRSGSAT